MDNNIEHGLLDEQANKKLKELHKNLQGQCLLTFWDTLECIGCVKEFERYLKGSGKE